MCKRIEITSKSQFFKEAHTRNYMTISKDYGLLATDGNKRTGQFIWALPHGEDSNPVGWIEDRNQGDKQITDDASTGNDSTYQPTNDQIAALKRFASHIGRTWKEKLKEA